MFIIVFKTFHRSATFYKAGGGQVRKIFLAPLVVGGANFSFCLRGGLTQKKKITDLLLWG